MLAKIGKAEGLFLILFNQFSKSCFADGADGVFKPVGIHIAQDQDVFNNIGCRQRAGPVRHYFCCGRAHGIPASLAVFLVSILTALRTGAL